MNAQLVARIVLILILVVAGVLSLVGIIGMYRQRDDELDSEDWDLESCKKELIDKVVDVHGFEYARYRVTNHRGRTCTAYSRVVPTTYAFSCPDCGGMVVGVDARRVRPGGKGPLPTAFRCESCGRQESRDFGVPRIEDREGPLSFEEPRGMEPVCPKGGAHLWEVLETWQTEEFPSGVEPCTENLIFLEEVEHHRLRCVKCGEEKTY